MKFTISFPRVAISTEAFKQMNLKEVIERELVSTMSRISQDTSKGKTADGGSLKGYSDSYTEAIKKGYVRGANGVRKVRTSPTDLTITGELLRSMAVRQTSTGGVGGEIAFIGNHAGRRASAGRPSQSIKSKAGKASQKSGATNSQVSGTKQQKAPQAKSARRNAQTVKASASGKKRAGGAGGGDMPNATLAAALYAQGFTGWFSFAPQDFERISKTLNDKIAAIMSNLVVIK